METAIIETPTLDSLVTQITGFSDNKEDLLDHSDYGKRFHSTFGLFIANYTLGVSSDFRYAWQNEYNLVDKRTIGKLERKADAIRNNGEENSEYTLRRCESAEKLHGLLQWNEGPKAALIIGYLASAAAKTNSVMGSFNFFYSHDDKDKHPSKSFQMYNHDAQELRSHQRIAQRKFAELTKGMKDTLCWWLGKYGYDVLRNSTTQTILFKDNIPNESIVEKSLPEFASAPAVTDDNFYKEFGKQLVSVYGLH